MTYGGYFERFIATLTEKELRKLDYIISLLESEERLPVKLKSLRDGLYELRMEYTAIYTAYSSYLTTGLLWYFSTDSRKRHKRRLRRK